MTYKTIDELPVSVQNEVRGIMDEKIETGKVKKLKFKQARLIVKLKGKYSFRKNRLGMN